jgi:histidyl-tRNA synthetase
MPISPRLLKGFRDGLPDVEESRRHLAQTLEKTFRLFGFVPIDTPALEYADILLGKGGGETDKQLYRFLDHGERDVALRYDLTVPFARFMAMHRNELYLPFKRYHIGKVWRGENPQRGRYREFMQCDFDIVGIDSASVDFEILLLMVESMRALGIEEFRIHLSHRGLFNRYLAKLDLRSQAQGILRSVDKLRKEGIEKVARTLRSTVGEDTANRILDFATPRSSYTETLSHMSAFAGGEEEDTIRLFQIKEMIDELGLADRCLLDPSITRGLDYYTGLVFETYLLGIEEIGSVCSGGRYNNLTSLYSSETLAGVGSSVGLDRLLAAKTIQRPEDRHIGLLVLFMEETHAGVYQRLAASLRKEGIAAEVYPERRKLAKQFGFAEKKGIPFALICGEEELEKGTFLLKDLNSRQSSECASLEQVAKKIFDLKNPGR